MEAVFDRKKSKYAELAVACLQTGWRFVTFPVEIGCRGYIGESTQHPLKSLGMRGASSKRTIRDFGDEAQQGSY